MFGSKSNYIFCSMSEPFITELVMSAFAAELNKHAGVAGTAFSHLKRPGTMHAMQAGLGSGLGLGLLGGAAVGGARGGKAQYDAARANGEGALSAAGRGIAGGLVGAVGGAGKGALAGAALGAAGGALAPTQLLRGTRALSKAPGIVGDAANFGQRQVHGLTGWRPGGSTASIERIGAGAADARKELGKAVSAGDTANVGRARSALEASEKAQSMGLTSLPGIGKSLKDNGIIPTVAAGAKEQWRGSSGKMKALMVGLPTASVGNTLLSRDAEGGPGKGERIGRTLGGTLGYGMAPLALGAGTLLGAGLERAGGLAGRGVDKLRGKRPQVPQEPSRPPASEPGDTGQVAAEHVHGTGFSGGSLE